MNSQLLRKNPVLLVYLMRMHTAYGRAYKCFVVGALKEGRKAWRTAKIYEFYVKREEAKMKGVPRRQKRNVNVCVEKKTSV